MSNIQAESGIQLLARIKNSKSSLKNIDRVLFPDGLKENDVVELISENIYLKNILLTRLISKTILVDTFNGFQVGGLNVGVLLIDTAFHFQFNKFATHLEKRLSFLDTPFNQSDKEEILRTTLKNLTYLPCYDSQQLLASLHYLHTTLSSNPNIKFIILDDVGANYWQDSVSGGIRRMDMYEKRLISTLQSCMRDFKFPILYVRSNILVIKHPTGCGIGTYKLTLIEKVKSKLFEVEVVTKLETVKKAFTLSDHELVWL